MSASREKKTRHADGSQKHQREAASANRSSLLYGIVIAIVAVAAVCILVWNSGIIQRNATAVTINGEKYTTADLQYYYNSTYSNILNQYLTSVGMPPFDYNAPLDKQIYDKEKGTTWHDYILAQSIEALKSDVAMADKAKAEGHEISQQTKDDKAALLKDLEGGWAAHGYPNRDAYLRANYGAYMTYDKFLELVDMRALAADYAGVHIDELNKKEYSAEAIDGFYKENADKLDSFTISQVVFQARVDVPKDKDGKEIEMSEEEKTAKLDEAKKAAKANAEEFKTRLEAGEDFSALVTEFGDKVYNSNLNQTRTGASVNSAYAEWAYSADRKAGDVTLAEFDGGNVYNYYVARFDSRQLDQSKTADVRHILVAAESAQGAEPTEEQYAAAKAKADELLAQWKAGEATEESFAELAKKNSADQGSAANGGLISGVSSTSSYVPTFQDWCMDTARKPGDTAIVKNTGSSVKGWHVMYYVADGEPVWKQITLNALKDEDFAAWQEEIVKDYKAEPGFGARYVHN